MEYAKAPKNAPLRASDGSARPTEEPESRAWDHGSTGFWSRIERALQSLDQAVAVFDAVDRLSYCNAAYLQLLGVAGAGEPLHGLSRASILDRWLGSLEFENEAARQRFCAERARQRGATAVDYEVRTIVGRWLRVNERPAPDGGIITLISDATGDRLCAQSLAEAQAIAEAAETAKSEFIEALSCELKTSLNTILGFAQLMERDAKQALPERHRPRLAQIMASGEQLVQLAHDIRELFRIESGAVSPSPEPLKVSDLIESTCAALRTKAAQSGIVLTAAPNIVGSSLTVLADRECFQQVLMHFGSSALQYGRSDGRVTFAASVISPEFVRVIVSGVEGIISLDDFGGVVPASQSALRGAVHPESIGMGFVIAQRLAGLMSGRVGSQHVPNQGPWFWVDLPAGDRAGVERSTVG